MPLVHRPGEAQVDFGYALVKVAGQLRKVAFFVMVLPYSDAFFVMAFERECTESFWEGHVRAFRFFGGTCRRGIYDNLKTVGTGAIRIDGLDKISGAAEFVDDMDFGPGLLHAAGERRDAASHHVVDGQVDLLLTAFCNLYDQLMLIESCEIEFFQQEFGGPQSAPHRSR